MAFITFNPGTVTQFDNGTTAIAGGVGSRFRGWTPSNTPVGPVATALGTGRRVQFTLRTDFGATFSVDEVPNTSMATMLLLQQHLRLGGTVSVSTEDVLNRTFAECGLAPDGDATIEMQDPAALLYRMTFSLINLAGTAMLCEY